MYNFGDIVLIEYPFKDLIGIKQRPAVVLRDTKDGEFIAARITGQLRESKFDIVVDDWRLAGLLKPSIIRVHKLGTFESKLVKRILGQLSTTDINKLSRCMQDLFDNKS